MKAKKIINLTIGSVLLAGVVGGIAAAAVINQNKINENSEGNNGFTNSSELSLERKRDYIQEFNTSLSTPHYGFDFSASYGTTGTSLAARNSVNLFRIESKGSPVFSNETGAVTKPTFARYVFEYGSKVIVTYADGTTREFDNDNVDEVSDEVLKNNKNAVLFKTSSDPKSINSKDFASALNPTNSNKAIKLQIGVKKGLKWTDSSGKATKYEIVPKDFYYSYVRSNLLTPSYRRNNGGSKEIDDSLISEGVDSRFGDTDRYPNGYLFGIFGVSQENILDEDKTLTTNGNDEEKLFTLNASSKDNGADFYNTFTKLLNQNLVFSAAPSKFIDEMSSKKSDLPVDVSSVSGLAKKFQIYDYGFDAIPTASEDGNYKTTTTLFGGSYFPESINSAEGRRIFTQNKNYVNFLDSNGNFVDSDNRINRIIERFIPSTNQDVFIQQSFNSFRQKDIDVLSYNSLSNTQQEQISQIVRRTTVLSTNSLLLRTTPTSAPNSGGIDEKGNANYTFNDAYSLLNYGNDLKTLSSGEANVSESYFKGFGLRFRSILQSAINWYSYASTVSSQQDSPWVNSFAPDAIIGGKDQSNSTYKTLRTGETTLDGANNTFTTQSVSFQNDENGNKNPELINVKANIETVANELFLLNKNFEKTDSTNSLKDYQSYLQNLNNLTNQFKSFIFEKAKIEMKALLDEFYAKYPNLNSNDLKDKIAWNLSYNYTGTPNNAVTTAYNEIVKTINSLDDRLNVSFYIPSTLPNLITRITKNYATSQFAGWGYDYEGIGTAFDGTTHGDGTGLVPAFALFAKMDPSDQLAKTFPEFYKLSKELQKEVGDGQSNPNFRVKIPFDKWDTLTNIQLNDLAETLNTIIKTNPNLDANGNQILNKDGTKSVTNIFSDISESFAKFFINYQNTHSNYELIALAREFNTIKGNSLEISASGNLSVNSSGNLINVLLQPRFSLPIAPVGTLNEVDIEIDLKI